MRCRSSSKIKQKSTFVGPISISTRNMALGNESTTTPDTCITSSLIFLLGPPSLFGTPLGFTINNLELLCVIACGVYRQSVYLLYRFSWLFSSRTDVYIFVGVRVLASYPRQLGALMLGLCSIREKCLFPKESARLLAEAKMATKTRNNRAAIVGCGSCNRKPQGRTIPFLSGYISSSNDIRTGWRRTSAPIWNPQRIDSSSLLCFR